MADLLKTYSVLIAWNDNDDDQGEFGDIVRATSSDDAVAKVRAAMRENHIENHCDEDMDEDEIAESCAEYEHEGFDGEKIFGGRVLDCHEGAIWKAAAMETALRDLLSWAQMMGGWESPAWARAEAIIAELDAL